MTTFDTTIVRKPRNPLSALLGAWRDWRDARATREMLRHLTARELDDIGLTRADVEAMTWRR
ncbi:DUF1127 domain-containing protein [Rubellimicrobium sp. CFH 75288]|uniref:DUF1127 domain-containing protein n=1 Tax=Rubellimicrobium sp. CFH 75288 TaxID=2697034 RepID=UPI001412D22D|nr:DUF1127 domain-containing protein [Rubellimicrobium sp. CFH 75288]NAZ36748.1 DUF1127 domain-containing protein [Rubellimicrobium sp. CFH 75288]